MGNIEKRLYSIIQGKCQANKSLISLRIDLQSILLGLCDFKGHLVLDCLTIHKNRIHWYLKSVIKFTINVSKLIYLSPKISLSIYKHFYLISPAS